MSDLTAEIALDVAWARPAAMPCPVINYSGPAFAGLAQLRAWGQPFIIGFESSTTRAYAGGDAGAQDAESLLSVLRTIPGYIEGGYSTWFCAADANSTPDWALPGVTDYFNRACSTLRAAGYVPHILFGYGNPEASSAAVRGCATAGVRGERWGIGTWREGEGLGANQPPAASDAAMLQSGNTPGPADGTDLDWLYLPVAELGFYGGPTAAPVTPPKKGQHMELVISPTRALTHLGGVLDAQIPDPTNRAYGIPVSAKPILDANPHCEVTQVGEATYDRLLAKLTGDAPPATPPVDLSEVIAAKTAFDAALARVGVR